MGLAVTLFLISFNVYNSVKAPPNRGFSYVDIWMLGMEFPILFAIVEYSIILGKFQRNILLQISQIPIQTISCSYVLQSSVGH